MQHLLCWCSQDLPWFSTFPGSRVGSEQPVLEQGLCPVLMSFVFALGHLWSFLLPEQWASKHGFCSVLMSFVLVQGCFWSFLPPDYLLSQSLKLSTAFLLSRAVNQYFCPIAIILIPIVRVLSKVFIVSAIFWHQFWEKLCDSWCI